MISRYDVEWTSDSNGDVTGSWSGVNGYLVDVVQNPDGTDAPSASFDITITDTLTGLTLATSTSCSATTTERIQVSQVAATNSRYISPAIAGNVTYTIANAGDTKKGRIHLFVDDS